MRLAEAQATAGDWLDRFRSAVSRSRDKRRAAIAFAAGALSNLALAPFHLAPILFFTLPVLVWLIDGAASAPPGGAYRVARGAARDGWWFGFGYFLFGLYWIGIAFLVEADKFGWLLPVAITVMPAGLALFWAGAAAAAALVWRPGLARIIVLALALGAAEWLRGHILTGFPWNVLGYALTWPLVLMQGAGLLGIYGLTLVAVPVFAAPLVMVADVGRREGRRRALRHAIAVAAVPVLLLAAYGGVRLASAPGGDEAAGARVRVVQPSVPQEDKWRPDRQAEIFQAYLDFSRTNAAGVRDDLAGITHVIWPEASMPFLPLDRPEALIAIGEMLPDDVHLLAGALRREKAEGDASGGGHPFRAYNSLMVFDGTGAVKSIYDKTHLVPFGEYLPWQNLLEAIGLEQLTRLRGGFTAGVVPRPPLTVPGLPPVGGLICYEAIFPGVRGKSAGPVALLVNVTNDGWFGVTTGPFQHFHQARVRAVEEGLPLIRSANNGISAAIDPSGRVLARLGLNAQGTFDVTLPKARRAPLYAAWGDALFLLAGLLMAATLLAFNKWRPALTRRLPPL